MKRLAAILIMTTAVCLALSGRQRDAIFSVTVFQKGDGGYDTFRIPAIVMAKDGSLLAFAEARKHGPGDTGDIDLVMKRSSDGGMTWGEMSVVWDDGGNVCGNPSPVTDRASGRIILVGTWNDGRDKESAIRARKSVSTRKVFVQFSDDNGESWSAPRDITGQAKMPEWTWYATGPCHAIQLINGPHAGRIAVACNHGIYEDGPKGTRSHIIYSDDLGETWNMSSEIGTGNEAAAAQLKNGNIMINMRNAFKEEHRKSPYRWVAVSRDGGKTFGKPYQRQDLPEPRCNASLTEYAPKGRLTHKLLFSNPSDVSKRTNMTVKTSRNDGKTWKDIYHAPEKNTAYSDLCVLPDGSAGLLYECGENTPYDSIRFTLLPRRLLRF